MRMMEMMMDDDEVDGNTSLVGSICRFRFHFILRFSSFLAKQIWFLSSPAILKTWFVFVLKTAVSKRYV